MNLRTLFSVGALVSCIAIPGVASARPLFHFGRPEIVRTWGGPRFMAPRVFVPPPVVTEPMYAPPVVSEPVVAPTYYAPQYAYPVAQRPVWFGVRPIVHAFVRPFTGWRR